MFGVARNEFFLENCLKQSQRSLQYDVNNLGTRFLSPCYSNMIHLVDSILIFQLSVSFLGNPDGKGRSSASGNPGGKGD